MHADIISPEPSRFNPPADPLAHLPTRIRVLIRRWLRCELGLKWAVRADEIMQTDNRRRPVVLIRWAVWSDLRNTPLLSGERPSLPHIARYWGANHTSIMYGISRLEEISAVPSEGYLPYISLLVRPPLLLAAPSPDRPSSVQVQYR